MEQLSENQFGYQTGKGTVDAVYRLVNTISEAKDVGQYTGVAYLDLRKAFDCVHHGVLLNRLKKLGLAPNILAWLHDYLDGRSQCTCFGNASSSVSSVKFGVSQGSVLGPLLFVYYLDSVVTCVGGCGITMYADDIALYTSHKKFNVIEERLQRALDGVWSWCEGSKLTINAQKSKSVLYASCSRSPVDHCLNISMGGDRLASVQCYTYLGVPLDSRLTFEPAIAELSKKVNNRLFNLAKIRMLISLSTALVIYKTSIATLFDYASFFYVAASGENLLKLQRLQNRGLRTCLNTNNRVHTVDELHSKGKIQKLDRRWDELMLTLMRKYYSKNQAIAGEECVSGDVAVTRGAVKKLFPLKRPNTQGYKKSPVYRGNMLWNVQPEWLKDSVTKPQFKRNLKKVSDLRAKYPTAE